MNAFGGHLLVDDIRRILELELSAGRFSLLGWNFLFWLTSVCEKFIFGLHRIRDFWVSKKEGSSC